MSEAVHNAQQEFWRPAVSRDSEVSLLASPPSMAERCSQCQREFMIGARFCHTCGTARSASGVEEVPAAEIYDHQFIERTLAWLQATASDIAKRGFGFPSWLRYLHFHEIKRWVGLPTASLIAFIIGLGCILGALGVSLFYRASNLGEFQAIQMWRVEWLLGATASFVAGILLKKPSGE